MENMQHITKLKEIAKDYTILFVEDNHELRKQIDKFLKKLFKEVYTASDGVEGVLEYKKNKPDLILTDLTMPNLSGHDMIRQIKKINPDVEIVILSAHSDSDTLMKSFHIGVSDFIAKPVNATKMIATFLKVLSNLKRREFQFLELAGQDPFEKEIVSESSDEKDDSEILNFIFENSMKIDVINHYKGVPIINSGKIIKIDGDDITLRTTHFQLLAIKEEKQAILDSSLINEDIRCSIVSMNIDEYEVVLRKQELFHPEFKDRNEIVIQPDSKTKAYVFNSDKERFEVKLEAISTKEVFINAVAEKFTYEKHDLIDILIVLSRDEKNTPIDYMRLSSRVYKIKQNDNKSVSVELLIKEKDEVESSLERYIYKRESELIKEFKEKFQYS